MNLILTTHAPRRQAREAAARWWLARHAVHPAAVPAPHWHALGAVPAWRLALEDRVQVFPTLPMRLAAVAAALWHAPALQRCVDAAMLQRLAEDTGEALLAQVLAFDDPGPAQILPAEGLALGPALRHMGRLILLAALPEPWRALSANTWGWTTEAQELEHLPAADMAGQRALQRAGRISATAWNLLANTLDAAAGAPTATAEPNPKALR